MWCDIRRIVSLIQKFSYAISNAISYILRYMCMCSVCFYIYSYACPIHLRLEITFFFKCFPFWKNKRNLSLKKQLTLFLASVLFEIFWMPKMLFFIIFSIIQLEMVICLWPHILAFNHFLLLFPFCYLFLRQILKICI